MKTIQLVMWVILISSTCTFSQVSTEEGFKSFVENFVLSRLPDPVGDAVAITKASPQIYKTGLTLWLNKKSQDACN